MNLLQVHVFFVLVPLLLVAVLSLMIYSRKGPHPATYMMAEPWTHGPILWAATDEVIGDPHGHAHRAGVSDFTVGGGASGKW